ncbi:flavin reductase family protein [Candidatus Nitrosocosmicus agrestis]|jgi:flavin reductase (DIM6/NTAB) family NADH-FMN oxidoreductase RutF|uniref:flavin reductase family protein n=1 Tax=Candidatus Nitrosocosmicus agrestis TaxID=2563600 RepID=UPI00122E003F|nr:flavin reductase family protein [Candidatus Nitrosocosmicus sp. SS]KAA2281585.1 flavin reductase family protein [Candidatus Nitrosocosmicus sp. SS]KAF0869788.1 flavin reductase family protein [Candidatus Nitrosocosmicus sp. SS]MDR4490388.1 flavin reductase family protein [Candidatus Nitrosocosmicus sp.]
MDLPWGDPRSNKFATSIGLVTSNGPHGHDIMACEWTHHLSYRPGLIAVSLGPTKTTVKNIRASKEFGINLCATDQTIIASVAGGYSGRDYDKINVLKEIGFQFFQADNIDVLMVKGASLNAECKLFKEVTFGDHVMLIGEVLEATHNPEKESLIYNNGKYWSLQSIEKPNEETRQSIKDILNKYKKTPNDNDEIR